LRAYQTLPGSDDHNFSKSWFFSGIKELTYDLSQGDHVKIVGGIFAGLETVVTQILSAKERVKVLMDFLGSQMEAEVERTSVLPQGIHPLAT